MFDMVKGFSHHRASPTTQSPDACGSRLHQASAHQLSAHQAMRHVLSAQSELGRAQTGLPQAGAARMSTALSQTSESFHSSARRSDAEVLDANQLKQQIQQQQRLSQVERKLGETLHFPTITETAVSETAVLFNAQQVSLLHYDAASSACSLVTRHCQNRSLTYQPATTLNQKEFPQLLAHILQGQAVQFSPALAADGGCFPAHPSLGVEAQRWLTQWPGSWLFVPIFNRSTDSATSSSEETSMLWGVMALALNPGEAWAESAIADVRSIAMTLALVMQHAQQYHELLVANQELQKLALSDGLTSLANRRRFDDHLANEWQRLARDRQPLSLILCDLDHFKRYNDTFGHPAGDRCLIRVARALLSGPQRPADLVARYGGEEFAIILPNTDTHGAWRIAQKIHESVRALKIDHAMDNEEPYITVTMGVSTVIPGHDNTPQMLLQASDLALYYAKQQGRNRTYINAHYNTVHSGSPQVAQPSLEVMPPDAE